jgi:hypothetical protein
MWVLQAKETKSVINHKSRHVTFRYRWISGVPILPSQWGVWHQNCRFDRNGIFSYLRYVFVCQFHLRFGGLSRSQYWSGPDIVGYYAILWSCAWLSSLSNCRSEVLNYRHATHGNLRCAHKLLTLDFWAARSHEPWYWRDYHLWKRQSRLNCSLPFCIDLLRDYGTTGDDLKTGICA